MGLLRLVVLDRFVEVEDLPERGCGDVSSRLSTSSHVRTDLAISQRVAFGCHGFRSSAAYGCSSNALRVPISTICGPSTGAWYVVQLGD
jgi:hypothetical protein